jgi:hypothetical protein
MVMDGQSIDNHRMMSQKERDEKKGDSRLNISPTLFESRITEHTDTESCL